MNEYMRDTSHQTMLIKYTYSDKIEPFSTYGSTNNRRIPIYSTTCDFQGSLSLPHALCLWSVGYFAQIDFDWYKSHVN